MNEEQLEHKRRKNDDAIIAKALRILEDRVKYNVKAEAFTCPDDVQHYLRLQLAEYEHEVFGVVFLDNRHRLISFDKMFNGTIDGASVYPREVVKRALQHNAAAVVLTHNHPSGESNPSQSDQRITQRLKDALSLVDVRVIDHIIVGVDCYSFAEHGLL